MPEGEGIDYMPREENSAAFQTARAYIERNVIDAKKGRKCIDGRYPLNTEDSGRIARPGGDFGYVMVLLTLNKQLNLGLTPEQCVDKVIKANGGEFYMHTDQHAHPTKEQAHAQEHHEKPPVGCGHIAKPTKGEIAPDYRLDPQELMQALQYAEGKAAQDNGIRVVNLEGEHNELGVFVVTGKAKSVNPQNRNQYFVYDKARDDEYIENVLIPNLNIAGVTADNFKAVSDKQLGATVNLLAKGKPVFEINADGPQIQMRQA